MTQTLDWVHEIEFVAETPSASGARDFVCLHLVEHQLPYLVDAVRLVVSELATNAILHANTPFTVTLSGTGQSVLLGVRDASDSVPIMRSANPMAEGGRGLSIVDVVSENWGVSYAPGGSKSVWAIWSLQ